MTPEAERDDSDEAHARLSTLEATARSVLDAAWRDDPAGGGFCVPNPTTYPWQWLWDSCFHAVIWGHLGDDRALVEVSTAMSAIDDEGFVPHVRYASGTNPHATFWGRRASSSITQPPMYGHALAELARLGMEAAPVVVDQAAAGLRWLLRERRRSPGGLVELCHPWESGCDDSPRWDDLCPGGWSDRGWYDRKGTLLSSIHRSPGGAPLWNDDVAIGSAGFSALVAFNARELAPLANADDLITAADELVEAIDDRWDDELRTWVDDGSTADGSGRVRTHDALLPALVTARSVDAPCAELLDPVAFGAPFGPTSVHRAERAFDARRYWRGSSWPQLTYLSWVAATSSATTAAATALGDELVAGAAASGWSEHWVADTGEGLGAAPQSWTGLAFIAGRVA